MVTSSYISREWVPSCYLDHVQPPDLRRSALSWVCIACAACGGAPRPTETTTPVPRGSPHVVVPYGGPARPVRAVAVDDRGELIATWQDGHARVRLWDAETGALRATILQRGEVLAFAPSNDRYLLVVGDQGHFALYDLADGARAILSGISGAPPEFSPHGLALSWAGHVGSERPEAERPALWVYPLGGEPRSLGHAPNRDT
jgi:hypothetical protein